MSATPAERLRQLVVQLREQADRREETLREARRLADRAAAASHGVINVTELHGALAELRRVLRADSLADKGPTIVWHEGGEITIEERRTCPECEVAVRVDKYGLCEVCGYEFGPAKPSGPETQ